MLMQLMLAMLSCSGIEDVVPVLVQRDYFDLVALLASLIASGVIVWQVCLMRKSLKQTQKGLFLTRQSLAQSRKEFNAAFPPELEVRVFYLKPNHSEFALDGQFYLRNKGNTAVKITQIFCKVHVDDSLKMPRPYEGIDASDPGGNNWCNACTYILPPGASLTEPFDTLDNGISSVDVELIQGKKKFAYVVGRVDYVDSLDTPRLMGFCRKYNVDTKRFEVVEDPDYEYSDLTKNGR